LTLEQIWVASWKGVLEEINTTGNGVKEGGNEADMRVSLSQYVGLYFLRKDFTHSRLDYEDQGSNTAPSYDDR
jgi:hypothetical protein